MTKIKIAFTGIEYDFTYYSSWLDNGHHLFFVITNSKKAIEILQLDHFFIDMDIMQGGQYLMNIIKNTPEEVKFKYVIARTIIEQHYQSGPATSLN